MSTTPPPTSTSDPATLVAGVVFVCTRDEALVEPFVAHFRSVYGQQISLSLANDEQRPVSAACCPHLPRLRSLWSHGGRPRLRSILTALHRATQDTGAPYALKLDVDALHLNPDWLWHGLAAEPPALGHAHPRRKGAFAGAAYAVFADLIPRLLEALETEDLATPALCRGNCPEDVTLSRLLTSIGHPPVIHWDHGPEGRRYSLVGWQPGWTPETYHHQLTPHPSLLHLGQHGGRSTASTVLHPLSPLPT